MPSKDGWTLELQHDKVQLGRKAYRNMEEWSRPCGVCGEKFSIFTRANEASPSASFGLRTCKPHRGQKIAGGTFVTIGPEIDGLRMANAVMKEELDGLYVRHSDLFAETQELKARLATYELGPAMDNLARYNGADVRPRIKMPWE